MAAGASRTMRPTPRKPERPVLWIIAGPNGSGKSSFYNRTDIEGWGGSVWIINPDLLTQQIEEREGLALADANLVSVERIERWLYESIEVYQTIGVETVLSTGKYRPLVAKARERGYEIRLIYVLLKSAELQLERVALRVAEGGHDVAPEKVVARRVRSFEQLAWFLENVDVAFVYDNSTGEPDLLVDKPKSWPPLWIKRLPRDLYEVLQANAVAMGPRAF